MRKNLFYSSIAVLCLFCFAAVADVTIAVIAPKAGEFVKAGNELFEGARLAVQEINDKGGINGEKLDMLTIDDRCDDRLAVSTAEMLSLLKSKKIGLVVGPYCSNQFDEIASIYEKSKIFQIVPTIEAFRSGSLENQGRILLLGTKVQMSKDFFSFYNQNFAGLKVGFIYDDQPGFDYSDVAKALHDEFRRFGKAEFLKFYILRHHDYADIVKSAANDGVKVYFVLASYEDVRAMVRRIKNEHKEALIFTSKKMISDSLLKQLGKKAEGLYVLNMPELKDSLMFTESLVDLRLLGVEPEGLETYSYVAVKLWGDLADRVGNFDYGALTKASNSDELREKWGEFLLHSGNYIATKYIIEMYKGGEGRLSFKQVY